MGPFFISLPLSFREFCEQVLVLDSAGEKFHSGGVHLGEHFFPVSSM